MSTRAKPSGWAFGEILTSAQMNIVDQNAANDIDGVNGGDYTPSAPVRIKGKGLSVGIATGDDTPLSTANTKWLGAAMDMSCGPAVALTMNNICSYNEGLMIATCGSTDKIASSKDDGFSWVDKSASLSPAQSISLVSCAAGAGIILLGGNSAKLYNGVDETAFSNFTLPGSPTRIGRLHYSPTHSLFIAGGNTSSAPYAASITTGLVPTARTVPASITGVNDCTGIAESTAGLLVAAWDNSTKVAFSSDGTTWTASSTTLSSGGYRLAFGDGVFVALIRGGGSAAAYVSTDGNNWSTSGVTKPGSLSVDAFTCLGGVFAMVNGFDLWLSVDKCATWYKHHIQYLAYATSATVRAVYKRLHMQLNDGTNSVNMRSRRLGFSDGSA